MRHLNHDPVAEIPKEKCNEKPRVSKTPYHLFQKEEATTYSHKPG